MAAGEGRLGGGSLLAGGFLQAAALRGWSRELLREEAGCSFQSSFPPPPSLMKLPGSEHSGDVPETGTLGGVKDDDAVRERPGGLSAGSQCMPAEPATLAACPSPVSEGSKYLLQPGLPQLLTREPPSMSDSIHGPDLHKGTGKSSDRSVGFLSSPELPYL